MIFRLDRSRRAGPFLEWKVRIFAIGAVLGMAGMYLDEAWLTGVAIVVLASGALLGLLARKGPVADGEPDGDP